MKTHKDYIITQQLLSGDKQALRNIYHILTPKLQKYLFSKLSDKNDVDELTQDVWLNFLDALPVFSYKSSLWTFMMSIARHEVMDFYRKKYAKKAIQYVPFLKDIYNVPLDSSAKTSENINSLIESILTTLANDYASLLRLKYLDGLSVKDIAIKMNMSPKSIESKIYRARMAFKKAYISAYGKPAFGEFESRYYV